MRRLLPCVRLPCMLLSCVLLAGLHLPAWTQERIISHDSVVQVNEDGSLEVTEHIVVRAEGERIRRGIYRDFPTRYEDRRGNRVVVDLEVLGVQRNGRPEPWFTERRGNGVHINTGDDSFLSVPAEFDYTLRYRTTRQLGFFDGFDELYWNATGNDWAFPIERASVEVRLPQPVPAANLRLDAYTGAQGEQGTDAVGAVIAPGVARWRTTDPLAPGEGLTIALGFPKGLVGEPTATQRWLWLLKDNLGVLVALVGLLALLAYCFWRWRKVGRDPRAGVVIARYEPPSGYSPGGLRYMQRMGYDNRCFSADLLSLAVGGNIRIERDKAFLKDQWTLQRTGGGAEPTNAEQQALLGKLFANGSDELELDNRNASVISSARTAHQSKLVKRFSPAMFVRNGGSIAIALLLVVGSGILAMTASGGGGIPAIILLVAMMLVVFIVFCIVVKAPTPAGRALMDEIEGLKLYLGVAERDELASLQGPGSPPVLDAQRYETLLPYAVALEVEDAWTSKFTLAAGAAAVAAAASNISWYRGSGMGDLGSFSKAVGSSLASQIASSSSAPGSSSGGGGGGSSGGGGGGGGGGGR